MIKINLLGNTTTEDNSGKLMLAGYVASVIALVIVFSVMQSSISSEVVTLTENVESRTQELKSWEKTTREVKDMQAKEQDLRSKLTIIAILKKQKKGPVEVLNQLNSSIPDKAWLVDAREKDGEMKLDGFALDNQTISTFLKNMESSEFFPNVELDKTEQTEKDGVKIQQFVVKAKVSYGGKIETDLKKEEPEKGK